MLPLFQLFLDTIENIPGVLTDIKALTLFVANDLPMDLTKNGKNWLIREYKKSDNLTRKDFNSPKTYIKPFHLKPKTIEKEYHVWDGGGLTSDMECRILELDNS
jgi:hypothetical protein